MFSERMEASAAFEPFVDHHGSFRAPSRLKRRYHEFEHENLQPRIRVDVTQAGHDSGFNHHAVAGWLGGVAGVAMGHPFDTIKVLQQVKGHEHSYSTVMRCTKSIITYQGFRGFFQGLAFPLASVGAINSVFFGIYSYTLKKLVAGEHRKARYSEVFLSGALAGAVIGIPTCPIELVKVKLQAQTKTPIGKRGYSGPFDCVRYISKTYGLRGTFHGLNATVLREMPGFGVYMASYTMCCDLMTSEGHSVPSLRGTLLAGGLAGVLSWMVNIPIDNIKSKLQDDNLSQKRYRGMWHCTTVTYQQGGILGFWKGAAAMSIRAFVVNAFTLAVYTHSLEYLRKLPVGS